MESPLERIDKLHSVLGGLEYQCSLSDYIPEDRVIVFRSPNRILQVISRKSLTSDQIIAALNNFFFKIEEREKEVK